LLPEPVPINPPLDPVPTTWPASLIAVAEAEVNVLGSGTGVAPLVVPMNAWEFPEFAPVPATCPELLIPNIITFCHPLGDWTAVTVYTEEPRAIVELRKEMRAVLRIG
jgi:hypothetical protein